MRTSGRSRPDMGEPSLQSASGTPRSTMHQVYASTNTIRVPRAYSTFPWGSLTTCWGPATHLRGPSLTDKFSEPRKTLTVFTLGCKWLLADALKSRCRGWGDYNTNRWKGGKWRYPPEVSPFCPALAHLLLLSHPYHPDPTPSKCFLKLLMKFNSREDWNYWWRRSWIDHELSFPSISIPYHYSTSLIENWVQIQRLCIGSWCAARGWKARANTANGSQWSGTQEKQPWAFSGDWFLRHDYYYFITVISSRKEDAFETSMKIVPEEHAPSLPVLSFQLKPKGLNNQDCSTLSPLHRANTWV